MRKQANGRYLVPRRPSAAAATATRRSNRTAGLYFTAHGSGKSGRKRVDERRLDRSNAVPGNRRDEGTGRREPLFTVRK
jgi:hypothetical protein